MARRRQLINDIHRRILKAKFAVAAFGIILAACSEPPADTNRRSVKLSPRSVQILGYLKDPEVPTGLKGHLISEDVTLRSREIFRRRDGGRRLPGPRYRPATDSRAL